MFINTPIKDDFKTLRCSCIYTMYIIKQGRMANNSEKGQGSQRAVVPVMMIMMISLKGSPGSVVG
jgi:hypothetical protein